MGSTKPLGWMGIAGIFFCALVLAACTGGRSTSPPNPVSQQYQSQPPAGPAPSSVRPLFYDFQDIPVPQELSLRQKDSYVFQTGQMKAGLLTLRGRVDINSLINFFQMALPRENWRPRGGFRYRRSVLIFEKAEKICMINLYEKSYYTYVEIYVAPTDSRI